MDDPSTAEPPTAGWLRRVRHASFAEALDLLFDMKGVPPNRPDILLPDATDILDGPPLRDLSLL